MLRSPRYPVKHGRSEDPPEGRGTRAEGAERATGPLSKTSVMAIAAERISRSHGEHLASAGPNLEHCMALSLAWWSNPAWASIPW